MKHEHDEHICQECLRIFEAGVESERENVKEHPDDVRTPLVSTPGRSVEEEMRKLNERRARIAKKVTQ
jgi:hypothetical protein